MGYSGTTLKLNTGASMPAIGFGTWQDKDAQEAAVLEALRVGYRHIDTAFIYGTEGAVASAIEKSGIPRSEIFVTTKLWNNHHHPEDVEKALDESLQHLKTDYADLWLMHWPVAWKRGDKPFPYVNNKLHAEDIDYLDTWKAMEKLTEAKDGKVAKVRAIGVSNFSKAEVERLIKESNTVPAVHQMEKHPYLAQHAFTKWMAEQGIITVAYSPFGNSNTVYDRSGTVPLLIKDETLVRIGEKHGKTGAQTVLAWNVGHGHGAVPKSKTPDRIKQNLEGDFKLSEEEMKEIDALDRQLRFHDPSAKFAWNLYQDLDGKEQPK